MDAHAEEPPPDYEEIEHIPWSALVAGAPDWRTRLLPIGAAVAVAVIAVVVGVRALTHGSSDSVVTLPPGTTVAMAGAAEEITVDPASVPGTTVALRAPAIYTEADLMAAPVDDEARLAVMRAEWFVADYFTVDGDPGAAAVLRTTLGDPELVLPHDGPDATSYVEWARAFRVESDRPGSYRVAVAFRAMGSAADGGFTRGPVEAVTVDLEVDPDGVVIVLDLPAPAALPATGEAGLRPVPATAPPEVVAAAADLAARLGADPALVEAGQDERGWRVVMAVTGPGDLRWPIVVRPETAGG